MNDRYGDVIKNQADLANAKYDAYLQKEREVDQSNQDCERMEQQ
jgi:hypothetical protein